MSEIKYAHTHKRNLKEWVVFDFTYFTLQLPGYPSLHCGSMGILSVFNNSLLASRKICDRSPDNNLSGKTNGRDVWLKVQYLVIRDSSSTQGKARLCTMLRYSFFSFYQTQNFRAGCTASAPRQTPTILSNISGNGVHPSPTRSHHPCNYWGGFPWTMGRLRW